MQSYLILKISNKITLPETNIAPENGWLEICWNTSFFLGRLIFRCELLVSGRVSSFISHIFVRSNLRFPDLPDEKTNYVHQGFLGHKQRLDERMKKAPMAPLKDSLKLWGIETSAESWI